MQEQACNSPAGLAALQWPCSSSYVITGSC